MGYTFTHYDFDMDLFNYENLNTALTRLEIATDAAECHGGLSAVVATLGETGKPRWLSKVMPELVDAIEQGDALAIQADQVLTELYQATVEQLATGECTYILLLPDDEEDLALRAEALGHWCQGFLLGLQAAGFDNPRDLPEELAEIVRDLAEISQISLGGMQHDETEERAYTEIVEYLRVAVMAFSEEFLTRRPDNDGLMVH